jgi:hypothetical protein
VGRSDIGSAYIRPFRIIPDFGKAPENSIKSPVSKRSDVFHDCVSWSYFANETSVLKPESGTFSIDPGTLTGNTDVLAGEATGDDKFSATRVASP